MNTNDYIRALNIIAEPHFTSGGHFVGSGDRATNSTALAASYARWSLETGEALEKRICNLLRAREEFTVATTLRGIALSRELATIANAITWATSLVCERARELESKPSKSSKARSR